MEHIWDLLFQLMKPTLYVLDLYFTLKSKLEEILKRQIDLLEERAIRNRFFKQELDSTKVKIYEC